MRKGNVSTDVSVNRGGGLPITHCNMPHNAIGRGYPPVQVQAGDTPGILWRGRGSTPDRTGVTSLPSRQDGEYPPPPRPRESLRRGWYASCGHARLPCFISTMVVFLVLILILVLLFHQHKKPTPTDSGHITMSEILFEQERLGPIYIQRQ